MARHTQDAGEQLAARRHERDDCAHYGACLSEAAHGGGRYRGGLTAVPCEGCERYQAGAKKPRPGGTQRGDFEPCRGV